MIAAENSPIPALHSDTVAGGTGSSNPACSSRESGANLIFGRARSAKYPVIAAAVASLPDNAAVIALGCSDVLR